jgi:hypothetical protein
MEKQVIGPVLKGILIEKNQTANGTCNGVIETSNLNKYQFFNQNVPITVGSSCFFNMSTCARELCDFEATNISNT